MAIPCSINRRSEGKVKIISLFGIPLITLVETDAEFTNSYGGVEPK